MLKIPFVNPSRFLGLEIEGGYVKLAEAQDFAGSRKITQLIVKELASKSEEEIVEALKDVLDKSKGYTGHLTICIPHHKVTVRFLNLPSVNEKEIAGMIELRSAKELPFSKEEIISDYLITERTKDGCAKVALIIVHQDVINNYLSLLKKANLEPERITFSTEAILNWYNLALRRDKPEGCSILIDLDADNTDIAVFDGFHLSFSRGLSLGTAQLEDSSDAKNRLVEEIRRTFTGYQRQEKAKKIQRIFLTHSTPTAEDLKNSLTQEFGFPCEIIAPFRNLSHRKEVSAAQVKSGFSVLRVLGTVLDMKTQKLNLLPVILRQKQTAKLRMKRVYVSFILFICIILLTLISFAKKIRDMQLRLFYLDREINKIAPLAKEVEDNLKEIEFFEKRTKIEGSCMDILREVHKIIPTEISLSIFNYDQTDNAVILQGVSSSMSEIFKFINSLEKSPYLKNVQLKYAGKKQAKADGVSGFKIECTLER